MATEEKGTLKLWVKSAEVHYKNPEDHGKLVEPYVLISYGDKDKKAVYNASSEKDTKTPTYKHEGTTDWHTLNLNFVLDMVLDKPTFVLRFCSAGAKLFKDKEKDSEVLGETTVNVHSLGNSAL